MKVLQANFLICDLIITHRERGAYAEMQTVLTAGVFNPKGGEVRGLGSVDAYTPLEGCRM